VSGPHPDPLSDMLSKPHELDGRFEREAKTVTTCISDAALTSIAVSLKRIADAMDGGDASQGIQNRVARTWRGLIAAPPGAASSGSA